MSWDDDDMDAEKLKEILGVVSSEIPKLVEAITKTLYNQENAENMAKSVAQFYKSMRDAGMDDAQAYALTKQFMSNVSVGGLIAKAFTAGSDHDDDDGIDKKIEKEIESRIKAKLKMDKDEDE
ncbi:MAG: hypothetical protein OEM29_00130 [Thermoplasmata archaeon]|nr:hypothetical protein [Thermoplasmata archaeon]